MFTLFLYLMKYELIQIVVKHEIQSSNKIKSLVYGYTKYISYDYNTLQFENFQTTSRKQFQKEKLTLQTEKLRITSKRTG